MAYETLIAITGFMGVGKSSVARHLAQLLGADRVDLDIAIEHEHGATVAEIIAAQGLENFRKIESDTLQRILANQRPPVLSLGGGTWTMDKNRQLIKATGYTVIWLESSFDRCWLNIKFSRKDRPLAKSKVETKRLFDEREKLYCLADWHFVVRPELTSYDVAQKIVEQLPAVN